MWEQYDANTGEGKRRSASIITVLRTELMLGHISKSSVYGMDIVDCFK